MFRGTLAIWDFHVGILGVFCPGVVRSAGADDCWSLRQAQVGCLFKLLKLTHWVWCYIEVFMNWAIISSDNDFPSVRLSSRRSPSTVLPTWRKRRSQSDWFVSIVSVSRIRDNDCICTRVKKCLETFWTYANTVSHRNIVRIVWRWVVKSQGGWFNIKMSSYQYRESHCGDKTVVRSSYLHNGISYTGKMTSLYWIRAQIVGIPSWSVQRFCMI